MLRGVGIYSGCTRCYDSVPWETITSSISKQWSETSPSGPRRSRARLAELAANRTAGAGPAGLERDARWIGAL